MAICSNHSGLVAPEKRVRYNRWKAYQQQLSHRQPEPRFVREILFGQRRKIRYYQITKGDTLDSNGDRSWYIMTNLKGKNELGWADYRLTDYANIQRWWELVFSAYFLLSLQAQNF